MKRTKTQTGWQRILSASLMAAMLLNGIPASAYASDYDEIVFDFYEDEIEADDDGEEDGGAYSIDGTELTISEPGTYILTGSCENGSVIIEKDTTDVYLVLDDLELAADYTAPIVCGKNSEVFLEIEGDNLLTDVEDPDDEEDDEDFEGAAIKVKSGASLTIDGDGTLEIDASDCKNGIKGAASSSITIEGAEFRIDAANTALACDHELVITGGDFVIIAENDGVKADPDEDDDESEGTILITGGTFEIETGDDSIHGGGDVTITGGTFAISSGDDAIHSDAVLTIGEEDSSKGPEIEVTDCVEGFEGAEVHLYSGSGSIVSSDDGINAANSDLPDYDFVLNIYGGDWRVDAGGDGLDSNGDITISGGTTEAYGASGGSGGDTAMDCDGELTVTGGTVLAVDSSGITPAGTYVLFGSRGGGTKVRRENPSGTGTGAGSIVGMKEVDQTAETAAITATTESAAVSVSEGDELRITDSAGAEIYVAVSLREASCVMLSSEELEEGETYTLYIDDALAGSAAAATSDTSSGSRGGGKGNGLQTGNQRPVAAEPSVSFQDVLETDWYKDAVTWAVNRGIASGTSAVLFSPELPCTRGQIAVFLWHAAGSPAAQNKISPFFDVKSDAYYHDAVLWAAEQGITAGINAFSFSPDTTVTRSQAVALLYRAAGAPQAAESIPFGDVSANDYFASAVQWAVEKEITAGTSAFAFSPNADCSRSQIVAFLYRWLNAQQT